MKVRIYDVSSISHLIVHNGKPCDKYTATVKVGIIGKTGWASATWYMRVFARTERALEEKLKRFYTEEPVEVATNNLYNGDRKYDETQN